MLHYEDITQRIIACAMQVHREVGPGLLESAYQECMACEMRHAGLRFEREVPIPLVYREIRLDAGYRMDFVVEDSVILELKAVEKMLPVHEAQLMTYLKISHKRVGLMINFCVPLLKDGLIRRRPLSTISALLRASVSPW